jgi:hypothetical protein
MAAFYAGTRGVGTCTTRRGVTRQPRGKRHFATGDGFANRHRPLPSEGPNSRVEPITPRASAPRAATGTPRGGSRRPRQAAPSSSGTRRETLQGHSRSDRPVDGLLIALSKSTQRTEQTAGRTQSRSEGARRTLDARTLRHDHRCTWSPRAPTGPGHRRLQARHRSLAAAREPPPHASRAPLQAAGRPGGRDGPPCRARSPTPA